MLERLGASVPNLLSRHAHMLAPRTPLAGKLVSPWHEIPLYAGDGCLHYICEIPKETSAKMEVATVSVVVGLCIARSTCVQVMLIILVAHTHFLLLASARLSSTRIRYAAQAIHTTSPTPLPRCRMSAAPPSSRT